MILAENEENRRKVLNKLLPVQRKDFEEIFETMKGYPVIIRLLDPPLHEFLPEKEDDIIMLSNEIGIDQNDLRNIIRGHREINPMMGLRGCRLAVIYPEIAEMQTKAIVEAAVNVILHKGIDVIPEIMVPLVCEAKELKFIKDVIVKTADAIIKDAGINLKYMVGTMVELPRAALTADEIAEEAEFFSFGTNDLTQMTYGLSRDDAGKILDEYYNKKIFEFDPTAKIDTAGVGKLVEIGIKLGKTKRPDIELGVCGEHGGDPYSIRFFDKVGMDYVSCSPFRVPIARLAAAQAAIINKENKK